MSELPSTYHPCGWETSVGNTLKVVKLGINNIEQKNLREQIKMLIPQVFSLL